jgi:N-acyl-D-aspartate/D-glutamate deacylase
MVQASSAQVADVYGLTQRGWLKNGYYADVVVFDPKTIRDVATYQKPRELSVGVRWVFVNGKAALANGQPTGVMAGKGLRKR